MANKKTSSQDAMIDDVISILDESNPFGGLLHENEFSKISDYISSGSYILNALMTGSMFNGIPTNRATALGGESGCLPAGEKVKVFPVALDKNYVEDVLSRYNIDTDSLNKEEKKSLFDEVVSKNSKEIPIEKLGEELGKSDLLIDTPDGFQEVGDFFIKPPRKCFKINTADFKCSASCDHLFETVDGWKKTEELSVGDTVLTKNGFQDITSIEDLESQEVYDFEVKHENHRYWAGEGISSHNSGKTFIALNAIREAQKKGYFVIFLDSENAVDEKTAKKFGVDPTMIRYTPVATVFEVKTMIKKLTTKIIDSLKKNTEPPKIFLVLDSLGNLASTKETEDAKSGKDKVDMTRAKELKSLFRVLIMDLARCKIPFLLTNHTYDSQDLFSRPVFAGGGGAVYNASVIVLLRKAKLKEGLTKKLEAKGFKQNGIIVTSTTYKNRLAKPIQVKFWIDFRQGMNPFVGLQEFVSWETCGIEKNLSWDEKKEDVVRKKHGKYLVKHLGNKLVSAKDLFTSEVFTPEVLKTLDEEVIKPTFSFPDNPTGEQIFDDVDIDVVDESED